MQLQENVDELSRLVTDFAAEQPKRSVTESDVNRILEARRIRESCFGPGLFADPAWDILLHLYAAKLGQRKVSISSLVNAAAVPYSTGVRWVRELERDRWLVRHPDPSDGRRVWVVISDRGYSTMRVFFETLGEPDSGL
jgi:DNA-binding MarR family transcriptional regulator